MTWMADALPWIDAPWRTWTEPAAWMLLHAVWQGALVAAVAAVGLEILRRARPETRYALACAALVLMVAFPVVTTLWGPLSMGPVGAVDAPVAPETPRAAPLAPEAPMQAPSLTASTSAAASSEGAMERSSSTGAGSAGTGSIATWARQASAAIAPFAPWWVAAWALGVVGLSLRTLGGALYLHRLRGSTEPAPRALRRRANALRRRLGLSGPVPVRTSRHVDTPMALGWWKPVVLLPASLATGCPPDQLDALLTHELAHVRRHDVLAGWLQTAAETLLFFHPAVWWLSKQIRHERELCCDALAVRAGTDRVVYAKALAHVAERIAGRREPALAMAAGGGALLQRIRHVLAPATPASNVRGRLTVVAAGLLVALLPVVLAACASSADTAADGTTAEESAPNERRDVVTVTTADSTGEEKAVLVRNGTAHLLRGDSTFVTTRDDSTFVVQGDSAFVVLPDGERRALTDEELEAQRERMREHREKVEEHREKVEEHRENMRIHREKVREHNENLRQHRENIREHDENLRKHREQMSRYVDSLGTNEAPQPRILIRDGSLFIIRGDSLAPDTLAFGSAFPDSVLLRSQALRLPEGFPKDGSRFVWPDSIPAPGLSTPDDPFFILPSPPPGADVFVIPEMPEIPSDPFRLLPPDAPNAPNGNRFSLVFPDSTGKRIQTLIYPHSDSLSESWTREYRRWVVDDSIQIFSKKPGANAIRSPGPTGADTSEYLRKQAERMEEQARRLRERAAELESRSGDQNSDPNGSDE